MDAETLQRLIDDAEHGKPELPDELAIFEGGFSAPKVRRLLNALCSQPDANYLEIGVHIGSTLIPALYGNMAHATAIDNWSLMGNCRNELDANLNQFLPKRVINLVEADCFKIALDTILTGVNVYFYDGDHKKAAQYKAVVRYAPVLADRFVLLIDDWNWEEPREGTRQALADLKVKIIKEWILPGAFNGDAAGWWNGLYVGLIEKQSKG